MAVNREVLIKVLSDTRGSEKAQRALDAFTKKEEHAKKVAEGFNKQLDRTSKLTKDLASHHTKLERVFGRMTPQVQRLSLAYGQLAGKLSAVKLGLMGILGVAGAGYMHRVTGQGMQFQSSIDQSLARLTVEIRKEHEKWAHSRKRAEQLIKWGINYKVQTPYGLDQIMETLSGMAILYRGDIEKAKRATQTAALLASKNPRQGLMGAFIALQEAESGYMMSPMRRFNLPKNVLMKHYKQSGGSGLKAIEDTLKELRVDKSLMFKVTETLPGLEHQIQNLYRLVYGDIMEGIFKARREHLKFVRDRMKEMLVEKSTAHKLLTMVSDFTGKIARTYYKLLEMPVRFADKWLPILKNFMKVLDPLIANIKAFGKGIYAGFVAPFKMMLGQMSMMGKILHPFMKFFSMFTGSLGKTLMSPAYAGVPLARVAGSAVGLWLSAKVTGRAIGALRGRRRRHALGFGEPEEIREKYYDMGVQSPPELTKAERERLKRAVREAKRRARKRAESSFMDKDMAEIYVEQAGEEAYARWLRKRLLRGKGGPGYPTAETFAELQQRKMVSEFARAVLEFRHTVELMTRAVILMHSGDTHTMSKELQPFALMDAAPGGRFKKLRRHFARSAMTAAMVQNYRHWFENSPLFDALEFFGKGAGFEAGIKAYKDLVHGRSLFQNIALGAGHLMYRATGGEQGGGVINRWGKMLADWGSKPHNLRTTNVVLTKIDKAALTALGALFGRGKILPGRVQDEIANPSTSLYDVYARKAQAVREVAEATNARKLGRVFGRAQQKLQEAAKTMEGPGKKIVDMMAGAAGSIGGAAGWFGGTVTMMKRGARKGGIGGAWQALKGQMAGLGKTPGGGKALGIVEGIGGIGATGWEAAAGMLGAVPGWGWLAGGGLAAYLWARRRAGQSRRLALAYAQSGDMIGAAKMLGRGAIMGGLGTAGLGAGLVFAGGHVAAKKYMGVGLGTVLRESFPMLFPLILGSMAVSTIVTLTRRVMDRLGVLSPGGLPHVAYDKPVAVARKLGGWAGNILGWLGGGVAGGATGAGAGYLLASLLTNNPVARMAITAAGALYGGYKGGKAGSQWLGGLGQKGGGFMGGLTMSSLFTGGMSLLAARYLLPGGGARALFGKLLLGTTVAPWLGKHVLGDDSLASNPLFTTLAMFFPDLIWRTGTGPFKWAGRMARPLLTRGWTFMREQKGLGESLRRSWIVGRRFLRSKTWFGRNMMRGIRGWRSKVPWVEAADSRYRGFVKTAKQFGWGKVSAIDEAIMAERAAKSAGTAARVVAAAGRAGQVAGEGALAAEAVGGAAGLAGMLSRFGPWGLAAASVLGVGTLGYLGYRHFFGHRREKTHPRSGRHINPWVAASLAHLLPVGMTMLPINPIARNVMGGAAALGFGSLALNQGKEGSKALSTITGLSWLLALTRGGVLKNLLSPRVLIKEAGLIGGIRKWVLEFFRGIIGPDIWKFGESAAKKFLGKMFVKVGTVATEAAETAGGRAAGSALAKRASLSFLGRWGSRALKWGKWAAAPAALAVQGFLEGSRAGIDPEDERRAAMGGALRTLDPNAISASDNPAYGMSIFVQALRDQESQGTGGYGAVGPWVTNKRTGTKDRAYGAYQVMGYNIRPWMKKYLGIDTKSKEEAIKLFMGHHEYQDAIVQGVMSDRAVKLASGAYGWTPSSMRDIFTVLAASWYGGGSKLHLKPNQLPTQPVYIGGQRYPSVAEYSQDVVNRMQDHTQQGAGGVTINYNINGPVDAEALQKILDAHSKRVKQDVLSALQDLGR